MPPDAAASTTGIRLSTPVAEIPGAGVGVRRAELFRRLEIVTAGDLIRHFPQRYEREFAEGTIRDLPMEGVGSARGTIVATRVVPGAKTRFQATLEDHSERLALTWFNAGYLRGRIAPGMTLRVSGKVTAYRGYAQMVNPKWEVLTETADAPRKDERLRPVYPATEDLPSTVIEKVVAHVLPELLPQLADPLPAEFVRERTMLPLAEAYRRVHLPSDEAEAAEARRRLAYNELLLLQLGITLKRDDTRNRQQAPALNWSAALDGHIRQRFPFKLTESQEQVIGEIAADLRQSKPMNRLVQGDVGSGKTVIALYAMLLAAADRRQAALMAPTELLAEQHHLSISTMLEGSNVRVALLTGGVPGPERAAAEAAIESGEVDLVIGTQALLTESVRFNDLAVVVVDEQHRFGVLQRASFKNRSANGDAGKPTPSGGGSGKKSQPTKTRSPHYLVMTATPIPRTLSLTLFGDLDVSTIRGLPPGRSPITTRVVKPEKSDEVYRFLAKRIAEGQQAYVVVPAIDENGGGTGNELGSEPGDESKTTLKNVRDHAALLQDKFCKGFRVGVVHGRLKRDSRERIMQQFRAGRIDVLVATTVIEVGVDVPNATMMVVEHAERFGLAQLHQLRGRVGRGSNGKRSVCAYIAEAKTPDAEQRLAALAGTNDGFVIAEKDLEIRGMGEFFGTKQHGAPPLKVAQFPGDMELLQLARRDAAAIVEADPTLADPSRQRLRKVLLQQHGDALGLVDVG